ncbi:hypothetical protein [Labrys neptuniae]
MESRAFELVSKVNHAAAEAQRRGWNSIVGPRCQYIREEGTHVVFLHPTKGYRRITKRRLGLAD